VFFLLHARGVERLPLFEHGVIKSHRLYRGGPNDYQNHSVLFRYESNFPFLLSIFFSVPIARTSRCTSTISTQFPRHTGMELLGRAHVRSGAGLNSGLRSQTRDSTDSSPRRLLGCALLIGFRARHQDTEQSARQGLLLHSSRGVGMSNPS
jgi:hypothetical protein